MATPSALGTHRYLPVAIENARRELAL